MEPESIRPKIPKYWLEIRKLKRRCNLMQVQSAPCCSSLPNQSQLHKETKQKEFKNPPSELLAQWYDPLKLQAFLPLQNCYLVPAVVVLDDELAVVWVLEAVELEGVHDSVFQDPN